MANASGKVLAWALSFDDDAQVPKFLDFTLAQNKKFPDSARPVPTRRFMKFPGRPLPGVADMRARLPQLVTHGKNDFCPATPPKSRGTLVARVWGRRVEKDGTLCQSCISQENYIEDIFDIPTELQREVARAANAGGRFRLPENFARAIITYTYLGQLDVRPVAPPVPQHRARAHTLEWFAEPVPSEKGPQRYRITGQSDVESSHPGRGDGAQYFHRVKLQWRGFIDLRDNAIVKLGLWAEGTEKLQWGNPRLRLLKESDVAHLMAGRAIDFDSPVRYGVIGKPVAEKNIWRGNGASPQLGGPRSPIEAKLRRIHMEVQRLMRQGKRAEAERILDRLLRELEKTRE